MQQGFPSGDVLEGGVSVSLGGRPVDPVSLSVEREFSDSLPGGGSFTAASGEVSYVPGPEVSSRVATPWEPSPGVPMAEESVSVSMDVGLGPVSVLPRGRVSDSSAGTGSRVVSVGFTDLYRSLDRDITWEGMAARMPAEGDAAYWRNPGLFGVSIVDRIFRHCGWYATPPMMGGAVVSAPMQGSAWPEVGTLTVADRLSAPGAAPGWITSPWGMQATDANLKYTPASAKSLVDGAMEATVMLPSTGTARVTFTFGARRMHFVWTSTTVYVSAETSVGSTVTLVTTPRSVAPAAVAVSMRAVRWNATEIRVELGFSTGEKVTGEVLPADAALMESVMTEVHLWGEGRVGGFQVGWPTTAWQISGWKPSAVIRARAGIPNRLQVLPPAIGRNCANMLQELAQAEYATFWIDERGVMQWWDIDRLESQLNVATLTTADHVTRLEWSQALSSVYRRAVVQWKAPTLSVGFTPRITLWNGRGETLLPGEELEEIVSPPADEVWLMPDLTVKHVGVSSEAGDEFNRGIGSFIAATLDANGSWAPSRATGEVTAIGPDAYLWKLRALSTAPSAITFRTPVDGTSLTASRRGMDTPIFRGKMKYTITDMASASATLGPVMAPELSVDTGWWVQYADEAQWLADKYASRVTIPSPELGEVGIKPFPGLQLGDKITISAPDVVGLSIQGIVYGDSRSISAGSGFSMEHTIRVRPISVSRDSGVTWEEWRASLAESMTHTQWASTQPGETFQQWGSAPLS